MKSMDECDKFLECNEPVLFGYHKRKKNHDNNADLMNTYDEQFINILYSFQIRSMFKSIMYMYFYYNNENGIGIFYSNSDSMLIRESHMDNIKGLYWMIKVI
jgi:hypothetical protein